MKLFFLRHGEAGLAQNDDLRELTDRGREDVARVAKIRRHSLAGVRQVLVSPILRAQQTADIVCREAGISAPRFTVDWLIHETPLSVALASLALLDQPTLLVGHQPLAGNLVHRLTGERAGVNTANLVEMEGDAFVAGFLSITHHEVP